MDVTKVSFLSGEHRLAGMLYRPEATVGGKLPAVVIYHGWNSRKERYENMARSLVEQNIIALTFDFGGCGESRGDITEETPADGFRDALAGYDFLTDQEDVDTDRVGVYGGSYGGCLAVLVSEEHNVKALVLGAPSTYEDRHWATSLASLQEGEKRDFRQSGNVAETKAVRAIAEYQGNLLVICHELDEVVPARIPQAFYDHAKSARQRKLQILEGAKHKILGNKLGKTQIGYVTDWFTRTL